MSESEQPVIPAPGPDEAEPTDTGATSTAEPENAPRAEESAESSAETLGSSTPESGPQRDPEEWVTGDQPATGPQKSYLDSLARQAGEEIDADLTKAEASEHIDRLQQKTGVESDQSRG